MSDDLHTPYPPPPPPPDPTGTEPTPGAASGADAGAGDEPLISDPRPTRADPGDWKRPGRGWRKMVDNVLDTLDDAADRVAEVTRAREMMEKDKQES